HGPTKLGRNRPSSFTERSRMSTDPAEQSQSIEPGGQSPSGALAYWKANLQLIVLLLAIWATVSFGCGILLAPFLNQFKVGQLPLGFWFAQQGSIYVFVVLIFIYAWRMDRLDKKHGVSE